MVYQIWDTETANMVGAFQSLHEAFRAVQDAVDHHGAAYVHTWGLEREDDSGAIEVIAEGEALAAMARAHIPA
jgi:hypothetical protein